MLATVSINQVEGDKAIQEQLILYKSTVFPNPTCQNVSSRPLTNNFMQKNYAFKKSHNFTGAETGN